MKVVKDAILTCSACGVEAEHELLYLSEHLCASRCTSCGETKVYSGHIYAEYLRDVFERTSKLPGRFAGEALRRPMGLAKWPLKAIRKPFHLLREASQLTSFERSRRSSHSRHRLR